MARVDYDLYKTYSPSPIQESRILQDPEEHSKRQKHIWIASWRLIQKLTQKHLNYVWPVKTFSTHPDSRRSNRLYSTQEIANNSYSSSIGHIFHNI